LVRRRGRPPKLGERQVAQVRRWAGEGRSQAWIAARYGVARSVVSRLLGAVPELRTLRERLSALAQGCDPLALQRAFATAMLATDPAGDPV
jgi:DNA-binding transcriptional regulator LsrR (DeoR family)